MPPEPRAVAATPASPASQGGLGASQSLPHFLKLEKYFRKSVIPLRQEDAREDASFPSPRGRSSGSPFPEGRFLRTVSQETGPLQLRGLRLDSGLLCEPSPEGALG